MSSEERQERLDRATSQRLAKLSERPVDLTRLEQRLRAAIQEPQDQQSEHSSAPRIRWWRPITAIAAIVLLVVSISWIVFIAGTAATMASPAGLVEIHNEAANELTPHLEASSVDEANRLLAEQAKHFHPLPNLPGELKYCCLHNHVGKVLTCAIIDVDAKRLTVAVADSSQIKSPTGNSTTRGGKTYYVFTDGGINLVMTSVAGSWLCVMGEASTDQLLQVAGEIQFDFTDG